MAGFKFSPLLHSISKALILSSGLQSFYLILKVALHTKTFVPLISFQSFGAKFLGSKKYRQFSERSHQFEEVNLWIEVLFKLDLIARLFLIPFITPNSEFWEVLEFVSKHHKLLF